MEKKEIVCADCEGNISIESLTDRMIIKNKIVYIPGLESIVEGVIKMKLGSRSQTADELLRQVSDSYAIPPGEEKDYREALVDYYERRVLDFQ